MKLRALDLVLLLAVLTGGFLAWRTGRERSRLERQLQRLSQSAGNLTIEDPSKVHILAMDTGEPLHFAWRVCYPPGYNQISRSRSGSSGSGSSSGMPSPDSREFIARVRFREDGQGELNVYEHFDGTSSRRGVGDRTLAAYLREHTNKIRVEQLGSAGLSILEPDGSAVLLRLTLPDDLLDEARKALSPEAQRSVPLLYELEIGPKATAP